MKTRKRLFIQLRLLMFRNPVKRGNYLRKKRIFKYFGDNIWYQPYKIPTQPKLVKIGEGSKIATEVLFMEHDIIHSIFNEIDKTINYKEHMGTIEIGKHTFIGARSIIMQNVWIGDNCIIGAGSIVTKDIPNGSIAAGIPAKIIGSTNLLQKKYKDYSIRLSNYDLHVDKNIEELFW